MKKEYKKPEMVCITLMTDEMMNVTSNLQMGGTTDRFDAQIRYYDDFEYDEEDPEHVW